jgi:hypothetical protein
VSGQAGNQGGDVHSAPVTKLCDERQAARRLGLSIATLRRRRQNRQPPIWVKLGFRVFYREQDLESFIEANVVCLPDRSAGDSEFPASMRDAN